MMRVRITFLIIWLGVSAGTAQQDAASYLAQVDGSLRLVQQANWQYVKAAVRARPSKVEKERQEFLAAINQASLSLSSLPPWHSSATLRDTALSFLRVSHAIVREDYGQVTNLEPIAESAFDAIEAFIAARQAVELRLSTTAAAVETEYKRFAEDNNLQLARDPLYGEEMNFVSSALHHYNKVYQIFFANYKQEAYLLDAIANADVSAIDQNREALSRSASSGLRELDTLPQFGDNQLRNACRKLLAFYSHEADESLAEAALHFVHREDLGRQTAAVNNMRAQEHDKKTMSKYEEAKEAFEKRNEAFVRTCAVLSQRRQSLLSSWQKSADHFIRKYVR